MDLKFLGYFISTISVILLAMVAWPRAGDPAWHLWAVLLGAAASILGMLTRYASHRQDKKDVERAARNEAPKH